MENFRQDGSHRIVVTGVGTVNPLGLDVPSFWNALVSGRSGIGDMTLIDPSGYECRIAGEVDEFDYSHYMDKKVGRRIARFSRMAIAASLEALNQAGIDTEELSEEQSYGFGVILGNGGGAIDEDQKTMETIHKRGHGRVDPFYISKRLGNMAAANLAIEFGLRGYNSTIVTACAAGTQAIGEAAHVIRRGSADIMITGGVEAGISHLGLAGFLAMKALSTGFNDHPQLASRPFDRDRDGFVPAEGAGILILESLSHARKRGATPLAEIGGYGCSADASFLVAPSENGEGAAQAMRWALQDAGVSPDDVEVISAHATSTPVGDLAETAAIHSVFGDYAKKIPVYAAKSMTGHMLAASGAIETIALIKGISSSVVPPTVNLSNPDQECDLDYVPNSARDQKNELVLNNSFGFGGQNSVLVIRPAP